MVLRTDTITRPPKQNVLTSLRTAIVPLEFIYIARSDSVFTARSRLERNENSAIALLSIKNNSDRSL